MKRQFEEKRLRLAALRVALALGILFPAMNTGYSQCGFSGLVVDVSALYGPCGLVISSPGLPALELGGNPYGLTPGDLVYFSYDTAQGQPSCGLGLPVSLNCVVILSNTGNGGACNALFTSQSYDSVSFLFQPYIAPPLGVAYAWDFGDGQSSDEISPAHTFPESGVFEVCLTITDEAGCMHTHCDSIEAGTEPEYCSFEVEISVTGLDLTAEIYNATDFGPYHPQVVKWIHAGTGEVLGEEPVLQLTLPDSSYLQELCVVYEAEYPDGTICGDIWCGNIWENLSCIDPDQIDPAVVCPNVFLPVCGCDGVTYYNECEAEYYYGVTSWTPGPCAGGYGQCVAYCYYHQTGQYTYKLFNTSVGDYDQFHWIVDGGQPVGLNTSPFEFTFSGEGYHTVCVEIWDTVTGCSSIFCQEVYCGDPDLQCNYTDCVWPGDANGNQVANVYDLLNIGMGYGAFGLPRPSASMVWVGQPAPDWGLVVSPGVDYKHADCNGDGKVIYDDLMAISINYGTDAVPEAYPVEGGLPVYFLFDTDTIYVDETTPEYIPITGGLYVGTPENPAVDLHGLGLTLIYPQQDLLLPWSTTADYLDNSFFGVSNQSLWMSRDLHENKRIDMGFTRKGGMGASGYGRIADLNFIVISDIIGGRTEGYIPFDLIINGIEMVDETGAPVVYDLPIPSDSLIFVNKLNVSSALENNRGASIQIFPNPSTGRVTAEWQDMEVYSVQVFNALGQELRRLAPVGGKGRQEWSLEGLESGIYMLRFQTDEGAVNKKLVIER